MSRTSEEPPVLPAYAFQQRWLVWCDHCVHLHRHGAGPGHRCAHCREPDSPYEDSGYVLKLARVVSSLAEARPGHAPLEGFLERTRAAVPELRYRILKAWLPQGRRFRDGIPPGPGCFVAGIRENTCGELDLYLDLGSLVWVVNGPNFARQGRGLHTLAEALFGVPADIAARRIAEIIYDDSLPAGDGDPNIVT